MSVSTDELPYVVATCSLGNFSLNASICDFPTHRFERYSLPSPPSGSAAVFLIDETWFLPQLE